MNELSKIDTEIISSLILNGDISKLNPTQRVQYITSLCERLGVDPLTQPFKILKLQGREVLYADKGCAQQLCKVYGISTEITKKEKIEDVYAVTVRASNKDGRFTDEDGIVTIGSSKGDSLANALMKAVTKAKRRAVLAFCGLGMLDETEIDTIPNAKTVDISHSESIPSEQKALSSELNKKNNINLSSDDLLLTEDQLKALNVIAKKNGYNLKEIKEFIQYTFELTKIKDLKNKHLPALKKYLSKPKDKINVSAELMEASVEVENAGDK